MKSIYYLLLDKKNKGKIVKTVESEKYGIYVYNPKTAEWEHSPTIMNDYFFSHYDSSPKSESDYEEITVDIANKLIAKQSKAKTYLV